MCRDKVRPAVTAGQWAKKTRVCRLRWRWGAQTQLFRLYPDVFLCINIRFAEMEQWKIKAGILSRRDRGLWFLRAVIQQFVHRWHSKTEEVEIIQTPSRVSCSLTSYFSYGYHEKDKLHFPAAAETNLRKISSFHNLIKRAPASRPFKKKKKFISVCIEKWTQLDKIKKKKTKWN